MKVVELIQSELCFDVLLFDLEKEFSADRI